MDDGLEIILQSLYCPMAFTHINITNDYVFPCCESYLDSDYVEIVKDISCDYASLVYEFKQSILDGSYRYCGSTCPYKSKYKKIYSGICVDQFIGMLPSTLIFSNDRSCNLTCKTCRLSPQTTPSNNMATLERFTDMLCDVTRVKLSGDGDPFFSKYYYSLLCEDLTCRFPKMDSIYIHTNGLLFDKIRCDGIHPVNLGKINLVEISIDAATPNIYALVRGGNYGILLNNIKYTRSRFRDAVFSSTFTVSRLNYVDMVGFVDFAIEYGFDAIVFNPMQQWGGDLVSHIGIESIADSSDYINKRDELLKCIGTKSIAIEVNL